jgi:hypothetical protein
MKPFLKNRKTTCLISISNAPPTLSPSAAYSFSPPAILHESAYLGPKRVGWLALPVQPGWALRWREIEIEIDRDRKREIERAEEMEVPDAGRKEEKIDDSKDEEGKESFEKNAALVRAIMTMEQPLPACDENSDIYQRRFPKNASAKKNAAPLFESAARARFVCDLWKNGSLSPFLS